jgi:hypothetical protein
VIPAKTAGLYDFSLFAAEFIGTTGNASFASTAQCSAFFYDSINVIWKGDGTNPVCLLTADQQIVLENSQVQITGTGGTDPFFQVDGATLDCWLIRDSGISGTSPAIAAINTATITLSLYDGSTVADDQLSVDGTSAVTFSQDASSSASLVQTDVTGTSTYDLIDSATQVKNNRASRDPAITGDFTVYVNESTGSDTAGRGTVAKPYQTVARAIQSIPEMGEYQGGYPTIQLAAGTYYWPQSAVLNQNINIVGATPATTTYTIDAAQPANTAATGTRLYTTSTAAAAGIRIGSRVTIPTNTVPGVSVDGFIYKADNSGAGGKLVLWVAVGYATPLVTVTAGDTAVVYPAYTTVLEFDSYSEIYGGYFFNCKLTGTTNSRDLVYMDGCSLSLCTVDIIPYATGAGLYMAFCDFGEEIECDSSTLITLDSCVSRENTGGTTYAVNLSGNSTLDLAGEVAFIGTSTAIKATGGAIRAQNNSIIRTVGGIDLVLDANANSAIGGHYLLPDIFEPKTTGGAVVGSSYTGNYLVNVKALTGAKVTLGTNSSVTISGNVNPVSIGSALASADASGTRILNGYPKPGASSGGASLQIVTTDGDTWNGIASVVVLDSSAMGAGKTFNLPATASINDGASVLIINEDGTNSVNIAKTGGDTINLGAGPIATGAAQAAITFTNRRSATNWMVS